MTGAVTFRCVYRQPVLVTATTLLPALSVDELKRHLRIDIDEEDELLADYIAAASAMVESDAQIALLSATYALYLDRFPDWEVELRKPPVTSITSIAYLDGAGDSQTLSASLYRLDAKSRPARVTPTYGELWPETYETTNAVTITFVAGETSRDSVPDLAKQAIRLLCGHWYRNRETVVSTGAVPQELTLAYGSCIERISWSGGL